MYQWLFDDRLTFEMNKQFLYIAQVYIAATTHNDVYLLVEQRLVLLPFSGVCGSPHTCSENT